MGSSSSVRAISSTVATANIPAALDARDGALRLSQAYSKLGLGEPLLLPRSSYLILNRTHTLYLYDNIS